MAIKKIMKKGDGKKKADSLANKASEKKEERLIKQLTLLNKELQVLQADSREFLIKTRRDELKLGAEHAKFRAQNNVEILKAIKKSLREEALS